LPGFAKYTRSAGLVCTAGSGLAAASAAICSGVAGYYVVTPTGSSGSSVQHGQSVVAGSMAEVLGVVRRRISRLIEGHCPVCHWKILRISVRKGRCQHLEVRTAKDRKMLMMINTYTHVA
jgi:hypothetical protein